MPTCPVPCFHSPLAGLPCAFTQSFGSASASSMPHASCLVQLEPYLIARLHRLRLFAVVLPFSECSGWTVVMLLVRDARSKRVRSRNVCRLVVTCGLCGGVDRHRNPSATVRSYRNLCALAPQELILYCTSGHPCYTTLYFPKCCLTLFGNDGTNRTWSSALADTTEGPAHSASRWHPVW